MRAALPGVSFTAVPPAEDPSPLRSDVAGFVVRARRGPVGAAVRVRGWREAIYHFGGLDARFASFYALKGYFEAGGEVAHLVRVAGRGTATASATWDTASGVGADVPGRMGLAASYTFRATSPGIWARGLAVEVSFLRWGGSGLPEMEVVVRPGGEPEERIRAIAPRQLVETVTRSSRFVSLAADAAAPAPAGGAPAALRWPTVELAVADEPTGDLLAEYDDAATALFDVPEVAMLVAPDLYGDVRDVDDVHIWLSRALVRSDALLDRMVVLDAPPAVLTSRADPLGPIQRLRAALGAGQDKSCRSGALYFPYLLVPDPLGTVAEPLRVVPPSGHVAGLIARLDRERGAHHTPANARLAGAVGLAAEPDDDDRPRLFASAVNLVRCHPRDGLVLWGGRTLAFDPQDGGFLAHRRLIHRLVRAIRRVAEPLVFDTNGPVLWLGFVRAVTTVMLSAFRAGALKGRRPEEAFRVTCDEDLNPPEEVDSGRCVCVIELAPAAPMEFIELRVALSRDGALEVLAE